MIQNDEQMLPAQQCIDNLRRVLPAARRVPAAADYARMVEPILPELHQRERKIRDSH